MPASPTSLHFEVPAVFGFALGRQSLETLPNNIEWRRRAENGDGARLIRGRYAAMVVTGLIGMMSTWGTREEDNLWSIL